MRAESLDLFEDHVGQGYGILEHDRRTKLMQPCQILNLRRSFHIVRSMITVCRGVNFLVNQMGWFFFVKGTQSVQFQLVICLLRLIEDFAGFLELFMWDLVSLGVKEWSNSA